MPRLLLTLTSYPPAVGGAQIHTHMLAKQLAADSGFDPTVVTQWSRDRRDWLLGTTVRAPRTDLEVELDGIPVHRFGLERAERGRLAPRALLFYFAQGWAIEGISELLVSKLSEHADGVDLIENVRIGREGLSFASWKLAQRLGVPFVFRPLHHPRWGGYLHRHYQELYRRADGLVALTQCEKETLIGLGAPGERICVTGIGPVLADSWDGERFRAKHSLDNVPIVLFLGQKYPYKGLEALLEAMPEVWMRHPESLLVAIGPRTRHSRALVSRGVDHRVLELGSVDLQEKSDALAACDLLCVPSSQESFGGVYTEAWALGKPVIGGSAPAIREVIDHGVDGFLVDQEPAEIATKIVEMLGDVGASAEMGERGRRKVAQRFAWDRLAALTAEFYQHLLDKH